MAWRRPRDKPLSEPIMASLLMHIHVCVTRPQWVNIGVLIEFFQMKKHTSWQIHIWILLSGVPDYFGRNKISSGGDLSHYSSASLY